MQVIEKIFSDAELEVFKIRIKGSDKFIASFMMNSSTPSSTMMNTLQVQMKRMYESSQPFCMYIDCRKVDGMGMSDMRRYAQFMEDTESQQKKFVKKIAIVCNWKGYLAMKALNKLRPFSAPSHITEDMGQGWNFVNDWLVSK